MPDLELQHPALVPPAGCCMGEGVGETCRLSPDVKPCLLVSIDKIRQQYRVVSSSSDPEEGFRCTLGNPYTLT
ncbi:hypothetical protein PoB_002006400 [Plakobranchus ocellatus]|uniref:Uncharacterized protein n=1 Tax=Plakobranchus ocellatus TaxID=259542 RepID=A0AAV3ZGR7_9GAST|nr:hypothetical protein PoB_002006400 [Plakobranchus ocellatus]